MKPYYEEKGIQIYHADASAWLGDAPSCSPVDRVITDPPYGVGLGAKRAKQRGGGVTARSGKYVFDDTPDYVRSVVVPIIEQCRLIASSVALTPGVRNMWMYPVPDDVGCFFSGAGTGMSRWGFTCMQPILYYGSDPYLGRGMGSRPNSCGQTYPNDANTFNHPCAKPIRMMRWFVNRASLANEVVLDPFMGSGSILEAAKLLGRRAVGIELEERHCEEAANRLRQEVLSFEAA